MSLWLSIFVIQTAGDVIPVLSSDVVSICGKFIAQLKNKELSRNKKMEMTCGDTVAQWSVITKAFL